MKQEKVKDSKSNASASRLLLVPVFVLAALAIYAVWKSGESNEEKQYAFYRHIADSLYDHKAYEDAIKFYESALTYMPDDRYATEQIKAARANVHIVFINTFGGVDTDEGAGLAATNDGGYLLAGNTNALGWILKTDAHGQLERRETHGNAPANRINALVPCNDGNFLAVGTMHEKGKNILWLLKVTQEGRIDWEQTWNADSLGSSGLSVTQAADSSFWVAGYLQQPDTTETDALLVHFTNRGQPLKHFNLGNPGFDAATSVAIVSDSSLVVAGYRQKAPDMPTTNGWVALIDTAGAFIWQQLAGGNRNDVFSAIAILPGTHITLAGHTQSYGNGSADAWLVQYHSNGQQAWSKVFEGNGNDMLKSLVALPDNSFAAAGYTTSYGHGGKDAWLLKINRNGSLAWKKEIGEPEDDLANAIIATPDGGYALCGMMSKAQNPDLCIIKTDVNGNTGAEEE
ncbi:hypothetical protein C7N43_05325 [Sphingobacteriales bacterium UPWRP_1]|nr:hypothetical protein BVG80_09820 [Sphingobacteriales bacterium TSM_CSM]PSJ78123.1 hypothetical protein C7N43_05325 [Sphingobacteriales bacterium UPWRP_1]